MNIKLDENLPADLAPELVKLGHEAQTLGDEGLSGARDSEVWQAAQSERRFLITQDLDFSDLRRFAPGTHPGVLLVRLSNPSRRALFSRVLALFQKEAVGGWFGCFVVATDRKVRIRRPGM